MAFRQRTYGELFLTFHSMAQGVSRCHGNRGTTQFNHWHYIKMRFVIQNPYIAVITCMASHTATLETRIFSCLGGSRTLTLPVFQSLSLSDSISLRLRLAQAGLEICRERGGILVNSELEARRDIWVVRYLATPDTLQSHYSHI